MEQQQAPLTPAAAATSAAHALVVDLDAALAVRVVGSAARQANVAALAPAGAPRVLQWGGRRGVSCLLAFPTANTGSPPPITHLDEPVVDARGRGAVAYASHAVVQASVSGAAAGGRDDAARIGLPDGVVGGVDGEGAAGTE